MLLLVAATLAGPANAAAKKPARQQAGPNATLLEAQVMLARIGFSPGVIDARHGDNFANALHAFQQANGLAPGPLDGATRTKLTQSSAGEVLGAYTIQPEDVAGPFVEKIPQDFQQMAALPRLAYHGPRELLAEKFHMSEALLTALNRGKDFGQAGTVITVANMAATSSRRRPPLRPPKAPDRARRLARSTQPGRPPPWWSSTSGSMRCLPTMPTSASSASTRPRSAAPRSRRPRGTLQVRSVARDPDYTYNPKYGFKGQTAQRPVKVAAGPNNPVGVVWIGLSQEGYGIHGTPEPEKVGKTQSHGCVRLTNWDALGLARLVKKGTPVQFVG